MASGLWWFVLPAGHLTLVYIGSAKFLRASVGFGIGFQTDILNLVHGMVGCGGSVFQKDIVNFVHICEAGLWQVGLGGSCFQPDIMTLVYIGSAKFLKIFCGLRCRLSEGYLEPCTWHGGLRWFSLPEGHQLCAHLRGGPMASGLGWFVLPAGHHDLGVHWQCKVPWRFCGLQWSAFRLSIFQKDILH